MALNELDPEMIAHQLGAGGVDNLVANAERICDYQQKHIEISNQGTILALEADYHYLAEEERRIQGLLLSAPPSGDLRRLHRRAIYCWLLTALLTLSGLAFTLLTLAPFRLGWMSWPFAVGIAGLTPFLVEKLLEHSEILVKALNAVATVAAVAGLMLLAEVRGNLLEEQYRQSQDQAVVIDDSLPAQDSGTLFYERSNRLLQFAMLFLAFSMEVGAGLALRDAWRSAPNDSEDWSALRQELAAIRVRKTSVIRTAIDLRNQPGIFVARFWRDFYRAMLSKAVRSAMTKLLIPVIATIFIATGRAGAQDRLNLVVALDLTQSVAVRGPDGKSEFQKNIDGVARVLAQVPAGAKITVIGITDHSFAQPYILMSARTSDDPGYFGERLGTARNQLVKAWKQRSERLIPSFRHTDILGALRLAAEIFLQEPQITARSLILFSDMRQSTAELNLESPTLIPPFEVLKPRCGATPLLRNVRIAILGADGAGRSSAYWQSLNNFWLAYLESTRARVDEFSPLRVFSDTAIWHTP